MRIVLITATYPTPHRPAQGAFNRELVRGLTQQHEVRVVAPVPWPQRFTPAWRGRPEQGAEHPTFLYPPKILRSQYGIFFWHSIRRTIKRMAAEFAPEIVLGYWTHPDGDAAVRAAARMGVPAVIIAGGTDLRLLTRDSRRRAAVRTVLQRADRVVVLSRELAEHADRLGIPRGKLEILYRGIDRSRFCSGPVADARRRLGLSDSRPHLLWVGRLVDVKNPGLMLRAARSWKRRWGGALRVTFIGEGPMGPGLRRAARRLHVDDVCHFVGAVPHDHLPHWYRAADLTVLTSRSEGIPNVLLESIACGTPFVATDVGGVREIATPGVDLLVPLDNEAVLAAQVIQRIQTPHGGSRAFEPDDLTSMTLRFSEILQRTCGAVSDSAGGSPAERTSCNWSASHSFSNRAAAPLR